MATDALLTKPERGDTVDAIYVIVAVDPEGNEGVCGGQLSGSNFLMPFVFSKLDSVDRVRPWIETIRALSVPGTRFVLRKYADPLDLETL